MLELFDPMRQFFSRLSVSSSSQADVINRLFSDFIIMSFIVLAIVGFMVLGGAILYRSGKRRGEPGQSSGNKRLEILWTAIPFGVVTLFFFLSLFGMESINQPVATNQKPDIRIIAHQWWWEFRYPKSGVITANELHIPVGERLLMQIESADVIHSWWVPALGRKTDAIPGHPNFAWIEADSAGTFEGTCSEYCGLEHAWMRISVIAESSDRFNDWIAQQKSTAIMPADSVALMGKEIFQHRTCGSCHAISGTSATGRIGPDLSHFGSRKTMLSGLMNNNRANLERWLKSPQKVKPGANMPNFLLSDDETMALTEYLEKLR